MKKLENNTKSVMILALAIGMNLQSAFAEKAGTVYPAGNIDPERTAKITFAPETPAEATFEETLFLTPVIPGNLELAPVTPVVADFNDSAPENTVDMRTLAPITPDVAEFEENPVFATHQPGHELAPVPPATADFEEAI